MGWGGTLPFSFYALQVLTQRAPSPLIWPKNVANEAFLAKSHIKNFQAFKMFVLEPAKNVENVAFLVRSHIKNFQSFKIWFGTCFVNLSTTVPEKGGGMVYLLCIWHMFCCRLTCDDNVEVPQYHRGVGGSVFALYLAPVLLSACLPRHSGSTTVPQGGGGVVHDTLEAPQYHRGGGGG